MYRSPVLLHWALKRLLRVWHGQQHQCLIFMPPPAPAGAVARVARAGMSGALKPWEGPPIVLDGSVRALCHSTDVGAAASAEGALSSAAQRGGFGADAGVASGLGVGAAEASGAQAATAAEVEGLRAQLAAAQDSERQWRQLYSDLHGLCARQLAAGGGAGPGVAAGQ